MKLFRLMAILPTLLPLSACALTGGPVGGQVLEEGTNKPVPGAIVVVRWRGDLPGFADSRTVCYHVSSATTDDGGHYRIPAWSKEADKDWQKRIINKEFVVTPYKAGYGWSEKPSQKNEIKYLAPYKGGAKERFDYLSRVISATSCASAGESYKNLYRVTHAVYEEAKEIARTTDEKQRAERFRQLAEDTLVNRSKPTKYDERGRPVNVDPKDTFGPEDLK